MKSKLIYVNDNGEELLLPVSRLIKMYTPNSDTSVTMMFSGAIVEGANGTEGEAKVTVTLSCSDSAEAICEAIAKRIATQRDLIYDVVETSNKITATEVNSTIAVPASYKEVSNTTTLYDYNKGQTVLVSQANPYTITLPTGGGTAGQSFSFVLSVSDSNIVKIDAGGANLMVGTAFDAVGGVNDIDNNMVHFAASATLGDRIDIISNGTKWLVTAWAGDQDDIVGANS